MTNDNTITLCSLAEPDLTRYTIENAIGWTAHMEYDQIIKCQHDGKPVLNIQQKQEEFIRLIKESGLTFRVKRIFHVIHPTLSWQHERKFTDSAMHYLKLFMKNDNQFTLLPSKGMTEDLERLQQNSPPLYDVVIGHLEAKENSSAGTLLGNSTSEEIDNINSLQQEQPDNMIQWTGSNLQEVIDFTGKSPKFGEWFKSWDEFESYVHSHGDILKLFSEDGSHFEVPVGAWIVKTPDGHNVPSVARFIHAKQEQPEVDLDKEIDAFFKDWDQNGYGTIYDENGYRVTIDTIKGVVKHFFNARKEE